MASAFWLNASIRAQPIPNSTNFPVKILFVLIINHKKASVVPTIETISSHPSQRENPYESDTLNS
jgi:hypothetical protein